MQAPPVPTADAHGDDSPTPDSRLVWLLRLGTFLCFAGWTWQHYYWEGPYGILVWHDATFAWAAAVGLDWNTFVGSGANDGLIQTWLSRIWVLYLAITIVSLTVRKHTKLQILALTCGSLMLSVVAYVKYIESQHQLPMLLEHGGQALMPIVLALGVTWGARHRVTVATAIVAVIATFAGHGLYACGFWPTPASFIGMATVILGTEYETTKRLLFTAGVVDLTVCLAILVPFLRDLAALYATAWGALTAAARPVAGMSLHLNYFGADQFLHEAILRAPHFVLPLYLLLLWRQPTEELNE